MERAATTRKLSAQSTPDADARSSVARGDLLVLDRYRLEQRIGAGGHGEVWQAFDEKLERDVAVKVIPRVGAPDPARAEREARVAARLNHPGIVALYEFGQDDDAIYLVSELVRGRTLRDLEAAGATSDRDVARLGVALADALAHAHGQGIVHRDVKPQNVIVVAEPAAGAGFAKLTDFGVAHVATDDPLTSTGDVVGTLGYMAPEQAAGRRVTAAADVYALALVLHEGWTGVNPARAAIARGAPTAGRPGQLARLRRDLPRELCRAIDAALEPHPERRPTLAVLREALAASAERLSDSGGLVEPGTLERVGIARAERRPLAGRGWLARTPLHRLGRLAAGLAAGALVAGALGGLGPPPPIAPFAAASAAALAVVLLPRLGWLAAAIGLCAWLASPAADEVGTALVLLLALAPIPLLMPRPGALWSAPALAPLFGLAGLAPAFAAVAGLAASAWRRAALAATGFVWLVATEILTGRSLLLGVADGTAPRGRWDGSLVDAARDAIYPAVTSPVLAPALVWAILATVLPLLVRGRALALDLAGAAAWAGGAVLAHVALGDLSSGSVELGAGRGVVAGAIVGALLAVTAARVGLLRRGVGSQALP